MNIRHWTSPLLLEIWQLSPILQIRFRSTLQQEQKLESGSISYGVQLLELLIWTLGVSFPLYTHRLINFTIVDGGILGSLKSTEGNVPKFSIDYEGNVTASSVYQGHTVPTNQALLPPDQSSANLVASITCENIQTDFIISFVSLSLKQSLDISMNLKLFFSHLQPSVIADSSLLLLPMQQIHLHQIPNQKMLELNFGWLLLRSSS